MLTSLLRIAGWTIACAVLVITWPLFDFLTHPPHDLPAERNMEFWFIILLAVIGAVYGVVYGMRRERKRISNRSDE